MSIKLDTESIAVIGVFEGLTGAKVRDCIIEDEHVIFVVNAGEMGLAIGKGGKNVKALQNSIGKGVRLYEYSEDPEAFIRSMMPDDVKSIEIRKNGDKKEAIITLPPGEKGIIIGKKGKNIQRLKALLQRHHNIDDIKIR